MAIVLRDGADARQAGELAGFLVAIQRGELAEAQRQLAVGVQPHLFVQGHVAGAVHGLEAQRNALVHHGWEHDVAIVVIVAGLFIEIFFHQVARPHVLKTVARLRFAHVVFHHMAQHFAFRREERDTGADVVGEMEQAQLLAQLAMVALLGFLLAPKIFLQLLGRFPGRAINALQLLVLLVAAPVGAGDIHQLERLGVDLARVGDVRTAAKIGEAVVRIKRDLRLLFERVTVFIQAALLQAFDEFQFVGLVLEFFFSFSSGDDAFFELVLFVEDLSHPFFNGGEIFRLELARQIEVVVKAVLDGRADGDLGVAGREHLSDGLGHDMRGRMADLV